MLIHREVPVGSCGQCLLPGLAQTLEFAGTWAEERNRRQIGKVQRLICDGTKLLQKS